MAAFASAFTSLTEGSLTIIDQSILTEDDYSGRVITTMDLTANVAHLLEFFLRCCYNIIELWSKPAGEIGLVEVIKGDDDGELAWALPLTIAYWIPPSCL